MKELILQETIEQRIFIIRGQKVMLDRDLAELFGIPTKQLNRQVKRNIERFPKEFMFQLNQQEKAELVPIWHQFKTMKHSHTLPYAFTEHGVAMLATVLNSPSAIKMSILIIKIFVKLREIIKNHSEITQKLDALERKVDKHDVEIQSIIEAIKHLSMPIEQPKRTIGFHT